MPDNELRKVAADKSRPREERREAILKLLEQPSPQVPGVSQGDRWGGRIRPWQKSLTEPGTAGPSLRLRDMSVPIPADAFPKPQIRTRSAQERLDSATKRLVAAWKGGQRAEVATLLQEVAGAYWQMGQPVTTELLRRVAAEGLKEAELEAKRVGYRKVAKEPWEQ